MRRISDEGEFKMPARGTGPESIRNVLEEVVVTLPTPDDILYANQLQRLASEQGIPPQQLKDEVDEWIENAKTLYEKGLGALYYEKYQEAEDYLRGAIESSEQKLAEKYLYLGNAQFGQKKYSNAVASYQTAIGVAPNLTEAHINLILAYIQRGKLTEAISMCKTAIGVAPNLVEAYNSLGALYHAQGKFDDAIEIYKKAISIDPDYMTAHSNLATAYATQGRFDEAIAVYKNAISIAPNSFHALFYEVCIYSLSLRRKGIEHVNPNGIK